ncbi:hypothetical protein, partial [Escherichia coli]
MEIIPIRPFSDPASIISLCRCTLENSNAPLRAYPNRVLFQ